MKLILDYPIWIYLVCILVGVVFSFLLYRKQSLFSTSKVLFWTLVSLRFILGFSLAVLLFNPLLQYNKTSVDKPIVAFLFDDSSSVVSGKDSTFIKGEFLKEIDALANDLSEDYQVHKYAFGKELKKGDTLNYSEKQTDISQALQSISDEYYNQNLASVILISDGIHNEGINPEYLTDLPKATLFSVALGDTTQKKDLILDEVTSNKIAFLGNKFPVKTTVKANGLKGEKTRITISNNSKIVVSKEFIIEDDNTFLEDNFLIEANKTGIQKFDINLEKVLGEHTILNNSQSIYVEILNSKQKILLLANSPHPDIAPIRSALETNKNYSIEFKNIDEFDGNINSYDAVVLHNLPSKKHSKKVESIIQSSVPTLFILGNQVDFNVLSGYGVGVNISDSKSFTDYAPALNSNFSLFQFSEETVKYINNLPPLQSPFSTNYKLSKQNIMAYQKVGDIATENPLIGFNTYNKKRSGYVLGEGLWRWKIHDFKYNQTHQNFNDFILKSIQYLSSKEDKSFFRVYTDKTNYSEVEQIHIHAELYNKSYELTNIPEVSLVLKNEDAEEFTFIFSKNKNRYIADISGLQPGNYTYISKTELNGEKFSKEGAFSVSELKNEVVNTVANHKTLALLSFKMNGEMFYPNNLSGLNEVFKNKENFPSLSYTQTKTESVINLKWIFVILILILSVEWFIRKREGGY